MNYPDFMVANFIEKSIDLQRVKTMTLDTIFSWTDPYFSVKTFIVVPNRNILLRCFKTYESVHEILVIMANA